MKRATLALAAGLLLAALLSLRPERADAHYVASADAASALYNSNHGGRCGDGATWWCVLKWFPWCYGGGDGACRTGSHSLQLQGYFGEQTVWVSHNCSGVYRMYHYDFGETCWENCS